MRLDKGGNLLIGLDLSSFDFKEGYKPTIGELTGLWVTLDPQKDLAVMSKEGINVIGFIAGLYTIESILAHSEYNEHTNIYAEIEPITKFDLTVNYDRTAKYDLFSFLWVVNGKLTTKHTFNKPIAKVIKIPTSLSPALGYMLT